MERLNSFESPDESLQDLLRDVKAGRIQLPDFQRGWIWDDEHIRSLLASVSLSYPIGAIMTLEVGDGGPRFQPRPVEGVTFPNPVEPDQLLLDGQQRVTSLFQAFSGDGPVVTRDSRGKTIKRLYYLDIMRALDPAADREEAIVSVPEDGIRRDFRGQIVADLSSPSLQQQGEMLPLSVVFNSAKRNAWMMNYFQSDPALTAERMSRWNELSSRVIERFEQYKIPVIRLLKKTPKEAVCHVFEKVNTGGVPLNVFELLTATFAMDDFRLRDDWARRQTQFKQTRLLRDIASTDFLQAVSLLATRARRDRAVAAGVTEQALPGVGCKRKDILALELSDYESWADAAMAGFEAAARLLRAESIFDGRDLPYRTQLVPLAAIFAVLGRDSETAGVRRRLSRWYWCGVLGELYGSAVETRFAKDVAEVPAWALHDAGEPASVADAFFRPARLLTLRTRNSAAYKGIHALIMRSGAKDFRSGETIDVQRYVDESIDIHHIFPKKYCETAGIPYSRCDSIVNKTPLSARTNRLIGGKAPSKYLGILQRSADIAEAGMDDILETHLVVPAAIRTDAFDEFFAARQQAILNAIEEAMGKPLLSAPDAELPAETEHDEWPQDDEENSALGLQAEMAAGEVTSRFDALLGEFGSIVRPSRPT